MADCSVTLQQLDSHQQTTDNRQGTNTQIHKYMNTDMGRDTDTVKEKDKDTQCASEVRV